MPDWSTQLFWNDVEEGAELPSLSFPLSIHRMIVQAGANKDFAPIHHNPDWAKLQGAPDMYANNVFLQSMWERVIREYIGLGGVIRKLGPFRMKSFTLVGETVLVQGRVSRKWEENGRHQVLLALESIVSTGVSMSGTALVDLPFRQG